MLLDTSTMIPLLRGIYPTWQEASSASKGLRVAGIKDYGRKYTRDSRLPKDPQAEYADFPGWPIFINRSNRPIYTTLAQTKTAAIKLGINSRSTYEEKYKRDPSLPSDPRMYPDFKGWDALFERGKYPTLEEAEIAVRKLKLDPNLSPYYAYEKVFPQDSRFPHKPHKHYEGFPGYAAFLGVPGVKPGRKLGRRNSYPTWQEASAAAMSLEIDSDISYLQFSRLDPRLPQDPETYYADFPGWGKFCGKIEVPAIPYSTWQEASQATARLDIYSKEEYVRRFDVDTRLPKDPEKEYTDFPGWLLFIW